MKLKYLFLITLISFNLPLNASAGEKVKSKITSDKTVASETNSNTSSKKALAKEFLDKSGFGNTFIKQLITNVLSDTARAGEIHSIPK